MASGYASSDSHDKSGVCGLRIGTISAHFSGKSRDPAKSSPRSHVAKSGGW
eukprot:CAMPEP_0178933728 /NCGR_PEP_ID=MMETSP0786-20121207/23442_1 /TAXON_ID=186022 /ORGANISM="Thalassionema frauenfeldii, Strain CCMP 1798" /LENGTH=50 /DNA_ID=CAMNT_0020611379 /DNA_START=165 /DNA_END=314 /DNA_ORIENTATION=+